MKPPHRGLHAALSVKETMLEANASLAQEKAMGQRIDNQAPAGAMKPCFVRALIQRGALR